MLLDIRTRMLLAALLPVTLVAFLLAAVFFILRVGDQEGTHQQRARSLIRQVASAGEYGIFSANTSSLQTLATGILREADVLSVTIMDARGAVLARAGKAAYSTLPDLSHLESKQIDVGIGRDLLTQAVTATQLMLDEVPQPPGPSKGMEPQLLGHVVMEFSRDSLNRREREMLLAGLAITFGGLLFGGVLAVLIGRGVVSPIMRVSRMIEHIGDGDLSVRYPTDKNDPLHDLQQGLNEMAARLETGRDELEQRIASATLELRDKKDEAELATLEKSRFLAAASHDLRQPTHALGMFVARLGQLPHDEQTKHLVSNLEASVHALQDLLDGLMDISKLDAGVAQAHVTPIPVSNIFDQIRLALMPFALDKGLRFRVRPTSVWVQSDPHLLQRMLLNLVANAVRYTERGSVLLVCRAPSGSRTARIEVWDSGIGIAPEHQGQVFNEFFQVGNSERDRSKGLGLGLNIVERTARLLSHPFHLRSSPGLGTRFTLEVPLATPGLASPPPAVETGAGGSLHGLKVLAIEDDALASEGLVSLLESWGCVVVSAANGPAALAQMAANGDPDVIISDFRLPDGVNGIETVKLMRQIAGHEISACLISGDTDQSLIISANEAGLTLLHKPVRPAKLRSLLRSLMRQNAEIH